MKQHITIQQFHELSRKGKKKLHKWYDDREKTKEGWLEYQLFGKIGLPILSIGQMIEFLDEFGIPNILIQTRDKTLGVPSVDIGFEFTTEGWMEGATGRPLVELCDVLWEAVKEVLEK